jgi:ABC-type methionine transport system permease subunit
VVDVEATVVVVVVCPANWEISLEAVSDNPEGLGYMDLALLLLVLMSVAGGAGGAGGEGTVAIDDGGSERSEEMGNTASQMLSMGLVQLPKSKYKDLLKG